jgi:hypothetical protein
MATTDVAKSNLTLEFGTCLDNATTGFKLEIDTDKHPDNASTFAPGDDVYIRVYPGGFLPEYGYTQGTLTIDAVEIIQNIEDKPEDITFGKSDTGSLSYWCYDLISTEWIGNVLHCVSPPAITISFESITLSQKVSGILRVKYKTKYDRIKLNCGAAMKVLVEAYRADASLINPDLSGEMYGNIIIDFEGEGNTREVILTVRDACSRSIISSASVYLDGVLKGTTNVNGRINLGQLIKARTYKIKVIAEGYQDTDLDRIANDEFTVQ